MKIVDTLNIYSLRNAWIQILKKNPAIKPTQTYEYYCNLFFAFYARLMKVGRWRMRFYYFTDDNDACIIPIVVNRKRKLIRSVSYYGRLDYDDIISTTQSKKFLDDCLQEICKTYPHYVIEWCNINEKSILFSIIEKIVVKQERCVAIQLPNIYEQYNASLPKHQRQNIRTAYNRLQADNISFDIQRYDIFNPISRSMWKQCEEIYERRHDFSYVNFVRLWYNRVSNPYHHILTKHSEHEIYVIKSNNIILAYMAGLYNEAQKTYYVPRLCINEKYSRYSPGIVLINETIKHLISQGTKVLDLMLGDERYKTTMGGYIHNNYSLQTTTDELLTYVHAS